jgi:hypothetical protein
MLEPLRHQEAIMTRMSNDAFPQNWSTFDGLVKATIIVGAIVAAVLITMTIAGANLVRPVQLVADGSEPPELVAHELHLERGGTLSGYQILY